MFFSFFSVVYLTLALNSPVKIIRFKLNDPKNKKRSKKKKKKKKIE